ncbi:MAG: CpaF family protein [Anaerolineae bacterium]|nr:CpaF family protein [Anaerolineae bacterium]
MALLRRPEPTIQPVQQEDSSVSLIPGKRVLAPPKIDTVFRDLLQTVQSRLLSEVGNGLDRMKPEEIRRQIENLFNQTVTQKSLALTATQRQKYLDMLIAEITGYGPIEPLLADPTITEIMINGTDFVFIERNGRIEMTDIRFDDDDHIMRIIDRIVAPIGRHIDESSPMVDARLPDGSRVNAIIPPLVLNGPVVTIRKFAKIPITAENLLEFGTITREALEFLKACVRGRMNILISGGTGSGKTTTLNILSGYIPNDERIITIEDAAELQLRQRHVITMEARKANIEGRGEVTIRQLVVNSLRMRPDRIIVGEVRAGEALDMLQAMNTGHDGSMTTLHANSPRDALARLETMVLMAGMDIPHRAIREQIASAINLVVHQERMLDGVRRIVSISEITGLEGQVIVMQDIFRFQQSGVEKGRVIGRLQPTGLRPKFMERLEAKGIHVEPGTFGPMTRTF